MCKVNTTNKAYKKITIEQIVLNELDKSNNWSGICKKYILSEDIIEQFKDKVDWDNITRYQTLSNEFIIRHYNVLNTILIMNQKLSEETIIHFLNTTKLDFINKVSLCKYQDISYSFACKYILNNTENDSRHFYEHTLLKFQKINEEYIDHVSLGLSFNNIVSSLQYNNIITHNEKKRLINYVVKKYSKNS